MSTPETTPHTAPEEIQWEIEQTRERLGHTVEELAAKADTAPTPGVFYDPLSYAAYDHPYDVGEREPCPAHRARRPVP